MADDNSLELEQDLIFHRREWRIQSVAWVVWGAVILAALVGLVGPGPLSGRTVSSADGRLGVEYDRFLHHHHPESLWITMKPDVGEDLLRLHLSRSLLEDIKIDQIEPDPESEELDSQGTTYVFRCQRGEPAVKAVFHLEFEAIGSGSGEVKLGGSDPVVLKYFVYP